MNRKILIALLAVTVVLNTGYSSLASRTFLKIAGKETTPEPPQIVVYYGDTPVALTGDSIPVNLAAVFH